MSSAALHGAARTAGRWQWRSRKSRKRAGFVRGIMLPYRFLHPTRIGVDRLADGPDHSRGHVIAVQFREPRDQLLGAVRARLEQDRHFLGLLDLALPAIEGK